MAGVKPIHDSYGVVTPYLIVADEAAAIAFYGAAFGATERMRLTSPDGRLRHAEIVIGGCVVMLADEFPAMGARGPHAFGGSPVHLHLYVADVDAVVARACAAGAVFAQPVKDQFHGDRSGSVVDPCGHRWHIASHIEDVPPDDLDRRAAAAVAATPKDATVESKP